MNGKVTILIFGFDTLLLQTRRWILERKGYHVLTITSLSDFDSIAADPPVKLLILCHTLDPEACDAAEEAASLRWPGIQKLVLATSTTKPYFGRRVFQNLPVDGPAKLVHSVELLMRDQSPIPHA